MGHESEQHRARMRLHGDSRSDVLERGRRTDVIIIIANYVSAPGEIQARIDLVVPE
jgi:hypothetical protein